MAQQTINLGAAPDDGTGDTLRAGGDKINDNFTELYTDYLPKAGGTLTGDLVVPDEAYDATSWNGSLEVPTKNAIRDKIESLSTGGAIEVLDEGVSETATLVSLDFVGAGVSASDDGSGNVTVTIAGGGGGVDVEDEGVAEASGATVLNFTGAGVTATDVGSGQVDIAIPGGGGSVGWTLVDQTGAPAGGSSTWTFSTNVAQVDITGLGSFNELLVIARGLSTSVAGVRRIQVSTDNGATFDTTAANYIGVADTGIESNAPGVSISNHTTNSGSARTLVSHIKNLKGPVKYAYGNNTIGNSHNLYVGSINDIDAIRINNNTGGNITAGTIYVFAR